MLPEVTDLDERRPELHGAADVDHDVVDDAAEVLLEEIGLEPVEGLLQVAGESLERVLARLRLRLVTSS